MPSANTFAFIRDTVQPALPGDSPRLLDGDKKRPSARLLCCAPSSRTAELIIEAEARIENWRRLQNLVEPYVATKHLAVLHENEVAFAAALRAKEAEHAAIDLELVAHHRTRDELNAAIK